MWEGSYGKEPFDLRLTILRMFRNIKFIFVFTLTGTLLFGGGYYIKKVLLRPEKTYAATSIYKVNYVVDPNEAGAYYVNEMSWNTFLHTKEFLDAVQFHLKEQQTMEISLENEELKQMLSAVLASDLRVPSTIVTTNNPQMSLFIADAVQKAMCEEFVQGAKAEINAIRVIDPAETAEEVLLDVRPLRAFFLSALLSFFFSVMILLLKELGDDSIWLPATLEKRYGLPVLGTLYSKDFIENFTYFFSEEQICVCPASLNIQTENIIKDMEKILQEKNIQSKVPKWQVAECPLDKPEICRELRKTQAVLLVVKAGSHSGKPLEYLLEYFKKQDCSVKGVLLCDADETLIRVYYGMDSGIAVKR